MSPVERFVQAEDVRLFARLAGEARAERPDVVLLHGFTGSGLGMATLADALGDAGRRIALDLVGHGQSDAPHDVAAYGMPRCTAQLAAALEALDALPCHLVGYSMGGRAALAFAVAHPQHVASLTLVGASAGIADPDEREARRRDDEALAARIVREGVPAFVEHWMGLPLFASQVRRLSPQALDAARRERLASRAHGLAHSLRGMGSGAQPPLHDALPGLHLPVLLLVGEEDAKFRTIAAGLADALPDARVEVVPDAGHAAHLENPAATADAVRRFHAGLAPGSAHPEPRPQPRAPVQEVR